MYDILTLRAFVAEFYRDRTNPAGVEKSLWIDGYGYVMTFASFNQNAGNATQIININANADFWVTALRFAWSGSTAFQGTINLIDAGSARPFYNAAVPLSVVAGLGNGSPGGALLQLPWPRYLAANTTISGALTGTLGSDNTGTMVIFFDGIAVKQFGPIPQRTN